MRADGDTLEARALPGGGGYRHEEDGRQQRTRHLVSIRTRGLPRPGVLVVAKRGVAI
jgi:hypothetical protein